ncbi:MAG TPA: MFS transporter [Patescibacteria group bacterium]|nr:MFS transporter [Patescibacteria group bacterium]
MANDFKKIISNPKFVYLWSSQIFSQVTINIMNFLLLAKLYMVTGSSIATSFLWLAYALPALVFGPIGAAVVDLVSRRKMLMVANFLQALTIFLTIFVNQQSIFILYAVVLVYSLLNQFYVPAESAHLPSTVSKDDLLQANSIFFITTQASLVLGFGFAGIIQRLIGFDGALILCSIFLFIAFVSTSFLEEVAPKKKIPDEFEQALKAFFDSIIAGYEFIRQNKSVLYPLLLLLGFQASLAIIVVSLPVIAKDLLHISVNYSGISIVLPAGIGALLGSIYIPRIIKRGITKIKIIEYSLTLVIFTILSLTFGVPYLQVTYKIIATPILLLLAGFGFLGVNIPTFTSLQTATPIWLRGRVFGNLYFLTTLISVFPVLFSGAIIEVFGIRTMLTILAVMAGVLLVYSKKNGELIIKD